MKQEKFTLIKILMGICLKISMVLGLSLAITMGNSIALATVDFEIDNVSLKSINVEESIINVEVSYPGPEISGVCGLEIRLDSYGRFYSIQQFLNEINVGSNFENIDSLMTVKITNSMTIDIDFLNTLMEQQAYLAVIQLKIKDGSTFKQKIKDILGDNEVVITSKSCKYKLFICI